MNLQKTKMCAIVILTGLLSVMATAPTMAQDITMFFASSVLEPIVDEYGNEFVTTPADAVIPFPDEYGVAGEYELEGFIVDPAFIYETFTDEAGNSYTTTAADDSLAAEAVFTADNVVDDGLWVLRTAGLPDMGVLSARGPAETEDAPQLKTSITMAQGGTYNVYLLYGDIGTTEAADDEANPTPIDAALEGEELQTFFQADGRLVTDQFGFNVLEATLGTVTIGDGGNINVIIDDHFGEGARTAYLGLRISEGGPFETTPPDLLGFDLDNKWMVYPVAGRELLISNGPGSGEDAPALTTTITIADAGKYEVIFHFMDSNDNPDEGWIKASLNGGEAQDYGAGHPSAIRATGGTSPAYPQITGSSTSGMFWYTASMGEVDLEAGDSITIECDDFQFTSNAVFMASVFEGVTLKVIEGGPQITDILVSTEFMYEWGEDDQGNRYTTVAADDALTYEETFTDSGSNSDNLWQLRRPNMGPYGTIYSGFNPAGTEDCPILKTMIEIAKGGTYDIILIYGDVAQVGTDDLTSPQPIKAGFALEDIPTWLQGDGVFVGLYGFNILETTVGQVTVADGETVTVYIDDAEEVEGNDRRSNYGGLRLEMVESTSISDWALF